MAFGYAPHYDQISLSLSLSLSLVPGEGARKIYSPHKESSAVHDPWIGDTCVMRAEVLYGGKQVAAV